MDTRREPVVVVFTGQACHLCEAALEVIEGVRAHVAFELQTVQIDGDERLEAEYRELLPVVEIDGERTFTWFVDPEALRERLLRRPAGGAGTM